MAISLIWQSVAVGGSLCRGVPGAEGQGTDFVSPRGQRPACLTRDKVGTDWHDFRDAPASAESHGALPKVTQAASPNSSWQISAHRTHCCVPIIREPFARVKPSCNPGSVKIRLGAMPLSKASTLAVAHWWSCLARSASEAPMISLVLAPDPLPEDGVEGTANWRLHPVERPTNRGFCRLWEPDLRYNC
jgi:hypothetical protein